MKNVKLTYQNYGTSILIFIQGDTQEAAYGQYLSLFNWGATASDPRYVADNIIACWSNLAKFQAYLYSIHETRIFNNRPSGLNGLMDDVVLAWHNAQADFAATTTESFRSVNNEFETFEFGVICAEKPDEDFADAVLKHAFANR